MLFRDFFDNLELAFHDNVCGVSVCCMSKQFCLIFFCIKEFALDSFQIESLIDIKAIDMESLFKSRYNLFIILSCLIMIIPYACVCIVSVFRFVELPTSIDLIGIPGFEVVSLIVGSVVTVVIFCGLALHSVLVLSCYSLFCGLLKDVGSMECFSAVTLWQLRKRYLVVLDYVDFVNEGCNLFNAISQGMLGILHRDSFFFIFRDRISFYSTAFTIPFAYQKERIIFEARGHDV